MFNSKVFNRVATVILAVMVCFTLFPIILMIMASVTDEAT